MKCLSPWSIGPLLGTQAGGQTLACPLGHWAGQGCGISAHLWVQKLLWVWDARKGWAAFEGLQVGLLTRGSGVGWCISLPQHFKLAVLVPRCSWNNREMSYMKVVSSTLCNSCLKADCIKYSVDGVGFVFALKWITLDSPTKITVLILPLTGLHMFVGNGTYFQLDAVKLDLLKGL